MASAEVSRELGDLEVRFFRLPITQREVGVTSGKCRTHPVFQFHIKPEEVHGIGNLRVSSGDPCFETGSVELLFQDSHSGEHQIKIDEIKQEGDILHLGTRGSVGLREIKHDGIVMLEMSMDRKIPMNMRNPRDH